MNQHKLSYFHKPTAAVIFGGAGHEHNVSVMSAVSLLSEAASCGMSALPIYISENGIWYVIKKDSLPFSESKVPRDAFLCETYPVRLGDRSGFLSNGDLIEVSSAFVLLHGDRGEDGEIQGALTAAGIPFFGESVFASAVTSDKEAAKLFADSLGIPTARGVVMTSGMRIDDAVKLTEASVGYPCFVKPASLGSSIGVGRADSRDELMHRLKSALGFSDRILIEEAFCEKRELECAYFSAHGVRLITNPGEILCDGFYDYTSKYDIPARILSEARIEKEISDRIREYTSRLADVLGIRHMARFDYFLLPSGKIVFNEVNAVPGMTKDSLYPKMLEAAGIPFSEFVKTVLGGAPW